MYSNKLDHWLRYYRTLKYLKFVQLWGRFYFKLKKPQLFKIKNFTVNKNFNSLNIPIDNLKHARINSGHQFEFLGVTHNIDDKNIWNTNHYPKLWLYNLHYFDELNAENSVLSNSQKEKWMLNWITANPAGHGCGWEPYPLSLRIVNWIKWCLSSHSQSYEIFKSLVSQTHYLNMHLEFHLQGNHLLANAKALIYAGLFFNDQRSKKWLRKGMKILEKQIAEQILEDGGHYELSPMYHALILEDLLDLIYLFQCYGYPIPNWHHLISKMFSWLAVMCHPDGEIAFFNDATHEISLPLEKLKTYASWLGFSIHSQQYQDSTHLASSGYARLQNHFSTLILDIAAIGPDHQPGHAHADTLSFELSIHNQRVFVNSGISRYDTHAERLRQRGTDAHNTVMVDHQNSSEVWSSFRVGRRAKIISLHIDEQTVTASHNGYKFIKMPSHQRTWKLNDENLQIIDELQGKNIHECHFLFHLHPEILAIKINTHAWNLFKNNILLATVFFDCRLEMNLCKSTFHPYFGSSIQNLKFVGKIFETLPLQIKTHIEWKMPT